MRWSRVWLLLALLLPAPSGAAAEPVRVYGIELEARNERQRLLVFADEPLDASLIESDEGTLVLSLPGALLDPSAPRRVLPSGPGPVSNVTAFDRADVATPEVRVVITHQPGARPELSRRGSIVALDWSGAGAADPGVVLQYKTGEDIAKILRQVAKLTGERFIFDEKLRGRITLIAPDRVSRQEAREMLHTALLVAGFAAVPTPGGPLKIVPIDGVSASAPYEWRPLGTASDAPITTLVRLEDADAEDLASQLTPWIGSTALVEALPESNSLILAGSEHRLATLLQIVQALDTAARDTLIVRRIRHAHASDVADWLGEIYGAEEESGRLKVVVDERANRLLIRVARSQEAELRERLRQLDHPTRVRGDIDVIRLRYVDPEKFGQILGEIASGAPAGPAARAPVQLSGAASAPGEMLRGRSFSFSIDPPTRSLVVKGDPDTLTLVRELVDELDQLPPRISVEVLVLQVVADQALDLGFDALFRTAPIDDLAAEIALDPSGGGLIQPGQGTVGGGAARITTDPLMFPVVDENGNPTTVLLPSESFVITAEQREIESHILIRPHLLVASGEEQEIFVGDNIPVAVASSNQANAFQTNTSIQRYDVGTTLRVRPTVGAQGVLQLELLIELSRIAPSAAGDVEQVGPTLLQRHLETHVRLADGEWVVVGLGDEPSLQSVETGTPFLKDIPVLGTFFRTTNDRELKTQLVIAVQGRIQRSADEARAETIRRRLGFERNLARTQPLREAEDGPVALLVTTRDSRAEAEAVADSFPADDHPARVVPWEYAGSERFDVYLTGFASISAAGEAAGPLAAEGWSSQIVVVPGAEPDPASLHTRPGEPSTPPF